MLVQIAIRVTPTQPMRMQHSHPHGSLPCAGINKPRRVLSNPSNSHSLSEIPRKHTAQLSVSEACLATMPALAKPAASAPKTKPSAAKPKAAAAHPPYFEVSVLTCPSVLYPCC